MKKWSKYHKKYIRIENKTSHRQLKKYNPNYKLKTRVISIIILIVITFIAFTFFYKLYKYTIFKKRKKLILDEEKYSKENSLMNDYKNNKYIILSYNCIGCGLLSHYGEFLSCSTNIIKQGKIPIVNLLRFPNIFNCFNESSLSLDKNQNPWEYFFKQPYGYNLKDVKTYAKHIEEYECRFSRPNRAIMFNNKLYSEYWHNLYEKYFPIKDEIIDRAENIRKKLFKNSQSVLGIFLRGTDFVAIKPKGHWIQPEPEMVFKDVDKFDEQNNYDFYFLATEDYLIRDKFKNKYNEKLKHLETNLSFNYNYSRNEYLAYNKNINGNFNLMKDYLTNIIILSKCIDIICGRTNGSVMAFILTKGFRNIKAYNLGLYK